MFCSIPIITQTVTIRLTRQGALGAQVKPDISVGPLSSPATATPKHMRIFQPDSPERMVNMTHPKDVGHGDSNFHVSRTTSSRVRGNRESLLVLHDEFKHDSQTRTRKKCRAQGIRC